MQHVVGKQRNPLFISTLWKGKKSIGIKLH